MSVKKSINENIFYFRCLFFLCLVLLMTTWLPSVAKAHKVNIFAYAEGERIFTESYFNDGAPCKGSKIQVYDAEGKEILEGETDEEGFFSFRIPQRMDLKIVLTASMGHKAEYRMSAAEIPETVSQKIGDQGFASSPQERDSGEKMTAEVTDENIEEESSNRPLIPMDMDQLRSVVEDAVDRAMEKRMKPLIHTMARAQGRGVSWNDIIGGIGYIFGLMGVILYFKKRKE
ncbi:MAG: hypothetical protein ACMUIM_09085 [bacterium]